MAVLELTKDVINNEDVTDHSTHVGEKGIVGWKNKYK